MIGPRLRRWLGFGAAAAAVVALGAALVVGWHLRERHARFLTDAETINQPAEAARPRDVLWRPPEALAQAINTGADESGPAVSADGRALYFARGTPGRGTDLWYSLRTPRGWSEPEPVAGLNSAADELDPCPSPDGQALYFASNRAGGRGGYDLWVARRDGGGFSAPVNLGPGVNSAGNDHAPALAPDGATLYFASNRPRGGGAAAGEADDDLYAAALLEPGAAAAAVEALNTGHDETAPAVSPAGDFLYFASDRPGGAGGFDLYRARRLDGGHLAPESLEAPVNTPEHELDPAATEAGFGLYFAGAGPRSYDLYYTTSREVFARSTAYRASIDWAGLWAAIGPYVLLLLAVIVLLVLLIALLQRLEYRKLTLLAKCLLLSVLVHLLLLLTFAFIGVRAALSEWNRPGRGTRVVLASPTMSSALAGQLRGEVTDVEIEAARPEPARADAAPELDAAGAEAAELAVAPAAVADPARAPVAAREADATAAPFAPATAAAEIAAPAAVEVPAPAAPQPVGGAEAAPALTPAAVAASRAGAVEVTPARPRASLVEVPPAGPVGVTGDDRPLIETGARAGAPAPAPHLELDPLDAVAPRAAVDEIAVPGARPAPARTETAVDAPRPALRASRAGVAPPAPQGAPAPAELSLGAAPAPAGASLAVLPARAAAPPEPEVPVEDAVAPARAALELALPAGTASRVAAEAPAPAPVAAPASSGRAAWRPPADDESWRSLAVPQRAPPPPAAVAEDRAPPARRRRGDAAPPEPREALELSAAATPVAPLELDLDVPARREPVPEPYRNRAPERRAEVLEAMGGSPETERAVAMALDWLARHQSDDGRWDGGGYDEGCGACPGRQRVTCDIALTGLAVLCFTAADHTHARDGPYRETVGRAVRWLVRRQGSRGQLLGEESMYSHGIATIALAEAYGMTGDPGLETPVKAACEFIDDARNLSVGGWRYRPGQVGDTSVMGWQIMALTSARRAGIDVSADALEAGGKWLELVHRDSRPGTYAYQPRGDVTPAMTAEAMFVRQLLGTGGDDPRQRGSAAYLVAHPPSWDRDPNTYFWYYATLALFQHQGPEWRRWNESIKAVLLAAQRADGRAAGSWDPEGRWAEVAGRVYQTAIATLTLEVYYRYLPSFVEDQRR